MSICVLVKVPEGLVLAADSASTVQGGAMTPGGPPGPPGVLKVFLSATKVMQIGKLPIGVMTWGAGSFSARTIASIVEEFANTPEVRNDTSDSLSVEKLAASLNTFMGKKSEEFFPAIPKEARPRSGLVLCGYSGSEFFPEEYVMVVPTESPHRVRPPENGQQNFGANWYGATDAIVRLHHGRDDRLFQILKDTGMEQSAIEQLKKKLGEELQYPILFPAMPLGDAIAYAEFVIRTTIDRFRFAIGAELCGGPIDVAVITRGEGFSWVRSKHHRQEEGGLGNGTRRTN